MIFLKPGLSSAARFGNSSAASAWRGAADTPGGEAPLGHAHARPGAPGAAQRVVITNHTRTCSPWLPVFLKCTKRTFKCDDVTKGCTL